MRYLAVVTRPILTLALLLLAGTTAIPLFAQGTWATKTSMPTARWHAPVGVVNGILYAAGGGDFGASTFSTLEAYDPIANSWTTKTPMSTTRFAPAVSGLNEMLYVLGGAPTTLSSCSLATVEAYNPVADMWSSKAPMLTARCRFDAEVVNGILYAVGGTSGTSIVGVLEAYDPVTDMWSSKAPMPTPRWHMGVATVNGILYAIGGGATSGFSAAVEAYDPTTDTWTTKASMPTARQSLEVGVVNGVIYAVGGYNGGPSNLATVEAYDPATNTWTTAPQMPTGRAALGVGVVNGVLYAIGGASFAGVLAANEAYTPDITAQGLEPPLAALVPEGDPVPSPDHAFKKGRTLPLKLQIFSDGLPLSDAGAAPRIVSLVRTGDPPLDLNTIDLDAGQANDSGVLFRFEDGSWIFNLSTKGLNTGTYTITIEMPDGQRYTAGFVLR